MAERSIVRPVVGARRLNGGQGFRFVLGIAMAGALGGLMFGFDIAIITGAGPLIAREFGLSHLALGWAFSSLLFGCVIGAAITGPIADRIGRKAVMIFVAVAFAATMVATGLAPTFTAFIIARFLAGVAVGAVSLVAPLYIAEVAPAHIRGRLGALYQMSIVTGVLVSYIVNYALAGLGEDSWRAMFISGIVPSALFLVLALIVPDSPRYLVKAGQHARARAILDRIDPVTADAAMRDIEQSLISSAAATRANIGMRSLRRPLLISLVLAVLVHASGINTIIDYAPAILQSAGYSFDAALLSTVGIGLANFVFTLISFFTIDRFGRRPVYVIGSFGMFAAVLGLIGAVLTDNFVGLPVFVLIIVYLLFFCSCIGPVFWTILPELFPNDVRGRVLAYPVLTQWVANAVVVLVFPYAFHEIGKLATFGVLAFACLAQGFFAYSFMPETKNRSLESLGAAA
ncbi:MAG: sugar porter family MFS transporter [Gammaproteobacteria bacterium]